MTYQQLVDSRIYWKGLAHDAIRMLEVLESQQPGITGRIGTNLKALSVRENELVLTEDVTP